MKTYRLSSSGRRTALILLIGALIVWAFALWTFRSTLGISYNPIEFWGTLRQSVEQGLTISQIVPALLMLMLIVATPLVIWNILEEWSAAYTPGGDGLRFESLGIALTYPWQAVTGMRRVDEDSDEPVDEIVLAEDFTRQIRNPVLRFLHRQAYGRTRLPIYAGLENRDGLLDDIRAHAGLTELAQGEEPAISGDEAQV
jgi:hypothetical protein